MAKKLKLTKIQLETKDGKSVDLTIDEAKELHDQLHELFGKKYIPSMPIVIERDRCWRNPWEPYWTHTSSDTPAIGSTGTQCKIEGASGLSVVYSGVGA